MLVETPVQCRFIYSATIVAAKLIEGGCAWKEPSKKKKIKEKKKDQKIGIKGDAGVYQLA